MMKIDLYLSGKKSRSGYIKEPSSSIILLFTLVLNILLRFNIYIYFVVSYYYNTLHKIAGANIESIF